MSCNITFHRQPTKNSCGATCLRILLEYYDTYMSESEIIKYCPLQKEGWNSVQLATAAYNCGLRIEAITINIFEIYSIDSPFIIQSSNHYIVVYKTKKDKIYVADPAFGKLSYTLTEFEKKYAIDKNIELLKVTKLPTFKSVGTAISNHTLIKTFKIYLHPYKSVFVKALLMIFVVIVSQTMLPFLTRAMIDIGLQNVAWDFIELLLAANIILVLDYILSSFVHAYLITHITNRVKYSMLYDYMRKMLLVKYNVFVSTKVGDLLQRVTDSERIQSFLSGACLNSFFSVLNLFIYSTILLFFDYRLCLISILLSVAYIGWNIIFLKQRKKLDYNFWNIKSTNNKIILQVFNNFVDIKCFSSSKRYLVKWKKNIFELFKQNMSFFYYSQTQEVGANIIIQSKNIILTYVGCKMVLQGNMTLGTLFAIQYIIGSLNTPLYQIADFFNQYQLVMISLGRIYAFNTLPDDSIKEKLPFLPKSRNMIIRDVFFRYPDRTIGLQKINLFLQLGKKYGIVGQSGCGKSTLLKLICGVLEPEIGEIWLGTANVSALTIEKYRDIFSVDLQESTLFEGSIIENIVGDMISFDEDRLIKCVEIACIRREIENMPNSYYTLIEGDNRKLSRGQAQRILIARAIYKQADIYVFDEIANCLNLDLEKKIVKNIDEFLADKTRIYVSHRTECLADSDLIYFMSNGMIADIGSYNDLVSRKRI